MTEQQQERVGSLQFFPVYTRVITDKDTVFGIFCEHIEKAGIELRDGDVVLVTSKIVSLTEGGLTTEKDITASETAIKLSKESMQTPEYCQAILNESDKILGCLPHVIATFHDGIMIANGGIDQSNVCTKGSFIPLPKDPDRSAVDLVKAIRERFGVRVGVIITDSVVHPLRVGTTGLALGVAGIKSVTDEIGKPDIFGRKMGITKRAVADNIACGSLLLMGETDECCPIVIARGTRAELVDEKDIDKATTVDAKIEPKKCLYFGGILVPNPKTQEHLKTFIDEDKLF